MLYQSPQKSVLISRLLCSCWGVIFSLLPGTLLAQTSHNSTVSELEILEVVCDSGTASPVTSDEASGVERTGDVDSPQGESLSVDGVSEVGVPKVREAIEVPSEAITLPTIPPTLQLTNPPQAQEQSFSLASILRYAFTEIPSPQLRSALLPTLEHSPFGDRIRAFTVTVWGETSWGSGVIVQQQATSEGWDYLVVTNSHVIRDDSVNVHTFDRQVHSTEILLDDRTGGYDLAILRFSSTQPYDIAHIQTEVQLHERTIAVGFPFARADLDAPENSKFHWTEGEIVHILDESLVDGYQFAYSNPIEKGMSGGPVLNLRGELIAINGLHAYPLWGNPFVYPNGQFIDPELATLAEESSWSIPIATIRDRSAEFWVNQETSSPENTVLLPNREAEEISMDH